MLLQCRQCIIRGIFQAVAMVMPRIEQPSATASGSVTGVSAASSAASVSATPSVPTPTAASPLVGKH